MALKVQNQANVAFANQAGLDEGDIDALVQGYVPEGVLSGCAVTAQGSPNMTVAVAAGQVKVGGFYPYVAAGNVTITAADGTNPRFTIITVNYNGVKTATNGTPAAKPAYPALPADNVLLAAIFVPANDTAIDPEQIRDKRVFLDDTLKGFQFRDEFLSGAIYPPWNFTGGNSASFQAGSAAHPGQAIIDTTTSSGNNARLYLGNLETNVVVIPADIARLRFIVSIPTVTSVIVKAGIGQDMAVGTANQWGTAGAWFQFDSAASANWGTLTRQASASTENTSGTPATANNWYQLDLVRLQNGNWQFVLNGTILFTHSANLPTTGCAIGILVQTATAASRTLKIDAFGLDLVKFGNRWT